MGDDDARSGSNILHPLIVSSLLPLFHRTSIGELGVDEGLRAAGLL